MLGGRKVENGRCLFLDGKAGAEPGRVHEPFAGVPSRSLAWITAARGGLAARAVAGETASMGGKCECQSSHVTLQSGELGLAGLSGLKLDSEPERIGDGLAGPRLQCGWQHGQGSRLCAARICLSAASPAGGVAQLCTGSRAPHI